MVMAGNGPPEPNAKGQSMAQPSDTTDLVFSPDKLFQIMHKRHVTPTDLADAGIDHRVLGSWLTGRAEPRPVSLRELARLLKVNPDDLKE